MDGIYQAIDWLSALLFAGAIGMVALSDKELIAARIFILTGSALIILRWGAWGMVTDSSWYVRAIVGGVIGAFILSVVPSSLEWINKKQSAGKALAKENDPIVPESGLQHALSTPPFASPVRHNIQIDNNVFSGVGIGISAPKDIDLGASGNQFKDTGKAFDFRDK